MVSGVGSGCMMGNALTVVGQYFEKRRSLAKGVTMAGASVGQLVIPHLMTFLLQRFGFWGALIIYASLYMNSLVAAFLLRPISFYTSRLKEVKGQDTERTEMNGVTMEKIECQNNAVVSTAVMSNEDLSDQPMDVECSLNPLVDKDLHEHYASTGSLDILPHQTVPDNLLHSPQPSPAATRNSSSSTCDSCRNICMSKGKPLFNWSLLKNPLYLTYVFGICAGNSGYVNVILFLPPHANDLGVDKNTAAVVLSMCGLADFVGRIFGGWFADLGYIQRNKLMALTLFLTGITAVVCGCLQYFWSLVVISLVVGSIGGAYISLFAVVLIDYCGIQQFSQAFGLTIMFMGFFNLPVPTIFGQYIV